jgi:ATP-dependent RNA helicase DHX8/PRP22
MTGQSDNVKQAVEVVERVSDAQQEAYKQGDDDSIDCAACFCPIDKGDLYRLQACGHPYCKACFRHQVGFSP